MNYLLESRNTNNETIAAIINIGTASAINPLSTSKNKMMGSKITEQTILEIPHAIFIANFKIFQNTIIVSIKNNNSNIFIPPHMTLLNYMFFTIHRL